MLQDSQHVTGWQKFNCRPAMVMVIANMATSDTDLVTGLITRFTKMGDFVAINYLCMNCKIKKDTSKIWYVII